MSKKLHVCVDGLNLALTRGTGIATYARNLANHLHQAGCKVSLLFDKRLNEKAAPLLYEVAFHEFVNKASNKEVGPKRKINVRLLLTTPIYAVKSLCFLLKRPSTKERVFPGIVEGGELKRRLPFFDSIYNIWGIYRVAQCYFWLFGELLPIKLSPTPDIMHWTCPIPARVIGAKNYYTIHDIIPLRMPHATIDNKKYFYNMLLKIINSADKLITVSEFSKKDIMTYLDIPEDKITNTYQNVRQYHDLETPDESKDVFSVNQLQEKFSLSPRGYFLFIGAIEPKKNVVRLLEGYLSAHVTQKLVVVGPLAWQSEKEQVLLKQYPDKIIYANYVSSSVLNTLLRNARALVFPSLFEGFGLPVMEAMSVGLPVITSNISSLPEVTGDAALLVNPYEVSEIASAIHCLANDDALCALLSKKGLERAKYFSSNAYAERLKSVYSLE